MSNISYFEVFHRAIEQKGDNKKKKKGTLLSLALRGMFIINQMISEKSYV
jgi:hypothetical protein